MFTKLGAVCKDPVERPIRRALRQMGRGNQIYNRGRDRKILAARVPTGLTELIEEKGRSARVAFCPHSATGKVRVAEWGQPAPASAWE